MQNTTYEMPNWMKHKLESRINNLTHADDTTLMAESKEELKTLLMEVKEKSEKAGLKQHSKHKKWHLVPSVQFGSITQLCPTFCDSMDCRMLVPSLHGK